MSDRRRWAHDLAITLDGACQFHSDSACWRHGGWRTSADVEMCSVVWRRVELIRQLLDVVIPEVAEAIAQDIEGLRERTEMTYWIDRSAEVARQTGGISTITDDPLGPFRAGEAPS